LNKEEIEMSESNPIVRDVRQYASYETSAGHSDAAMNPVGIEKKEAVLNLDELSAKEIDAYVNSGDLTAEQVYEHENAAEHPRKTVLKKYAPADAADEEEAPAEDAESK
jgi:rhodanese-related sulfurtransferase